MNILQKLSGVLVAATLCIGSTNVQAAGHSYNIVATTCGNWNDQGIHGSTTLYQIGFSTELPNEQAAYFEFNLTPAKGKTISSCGILIPGSTDYNITSYWSNPDNGNPSHTQFKVGIPPQSSTGYPIAQSEILTGNNSKTTWTNATDANRNPDLGYTWVADGLHKGTVFDCFHYESTGQVGPYLQNAVNAGGNYVLWTCDRVDTMQNGKLGPENYIWGSTSYNTGIILEMKTSN